MFLVINHNPADHRLSNVDTGDSPTYTCKLTRVCPPENTTGFYVLDAKILLGRFAKLASRYTYSLSWNVEIFDDAIIIYMAEMRSIFIGEMRKICVELMCDACSRFIGGKCLHGVMRNVADLYIRCFD